MVRLTSLQTTIQDLIQIKPEDFALPAAQSLKDAINTKYSNKIIQNIGLCVCLFDLLETSEGLIGHGTGLVNVNAEFRLIVFRPFRGEILQGRIKGSDQDGVTVDLDFTSEVFVPWQNLPKNTTFNTTESVWIWKDEPESPEMFFDKDEPCLIRVENEEWTDQKPTVVQKNADGIVIDERDTSWRIIVSFFPVYFRRGEIVPVE